MPPRVAGTPSAVIGGITADVQYAGATPGFVMGVSQWNVVVPANAPSGPAVPVLVNVGGIALTAGATLAVR